MTDIEFINLIRQNVEMGIDSISVVLPTAEAPNMKEALEEQRADYRKFYQEADELLNELRGEPKDVPVLAKLSAEMMGTLKSIATDDSKIAEEMVRGTTTGLAKLTRHLNAYGDGDPKLISLAKRLISAEEKNAETMKTFL